MFEKEAKEYRESITQRLFNEDDVESAWEKGAEFGYNKANEWHYVKDGDVPKDNNEKLCFSEKRQVVAKYDSKYNCWESYFNNIVTVIPSDVIIAWKEIVLPKESK